MRNAVSLPNFRVALQDDMGTYDRISPNGDLASYYAVRADFDARTEFGMGVHNCRRMDFHN